MPSVRHIRPNFVKVELENATLWFSYQTLIAFSAGGLTVVRRNDWGPTTGKHLNHVDHGLKDLRLDAEAFQARYNQLVNGR